MEPSTKTVRSTTRPGVALKTRGLVPHQGLHRFVSQRIANYLGRFSNRIRRVEVWVEDLNGPRGGIDRRCRINVRLRPHGLLTVDAQSVDEHLAITKAADRARTQLIRRHKKARTRRRSWLTRKRARKRAAILPQLKNIANDMNTTHRTPSFVSIGSTIGIRDLHSNEHERYTLTHPGDADIALNRISSLTPMGKAIYGRTIGDTVDVNAPGGTFRVRIETIDDSAEELAWAG